MEIRTPEEGAEGVLCGGGNSQGAYAEVVRTPLIEQGAYSLLLSLQEPAVCMTVLFICSFFSFIYVFFAVLLQWMPLVPATGSMISGMFNLDVALQGETSRVLEMEKPVSRHYV